MPKITIDRQRCKGCQLCIVYCKNSCIEIDSSINENGVHPVIFSDKDNKCTACSFCAIMCPDVCITIDK